MFPYYQRVDKAVITYWVCGESDKFVGEYYIHFRIVMITLTYWFTLH